MDALYGPFKVETYAWAECLVADKIIDRGARRKQGGAFPATISLGFSDLPTIVIGKVGDGMIDQPFNRFFTKENIQHSLAGQDWLGSFYLRMLDT